MRPGLHALRARMAWVTPTDAEERASAAVHGTGAVLAVVATSILLDRSGDSVLAAVACTVYGLSVFATMLASALFHSAPRDFDFEKWRALEQGAPRRIALPFPDTDLRRARRARRRRLWLAADHCAIFAMIAGSYTPVLLLAFPHPLGIWLTATEWALAGTGIAVRLIHGRLHWVMIPVFLAMGWLGFIWTGAIFDGLGVAGGSLLLAGGVVFTLGLIPYLWRSLPFNHAIWHGFVLIGAACHFAAIAFYALPAVA